MGLVPLHPLANSRQTCILLWSLDLSANIVRGRPLCHFPFSLGRQKYKGYGCQDGKESFLSTLSVAQTVAPGPGLEDMAEKGPSAAGGSAVTPAGRELGPFPGGSTSPRLASLPKCHLWAEPGRGEGLSLLSTPRFPHSVS